AQKERAERIQAEERARLKAEQERQRQVKEAELRAEKARLAQEKEIKARQAAEERARKEYQARIEKEAKAKQLEQEKRKREEELAAKKRIQQEQARAKEQERLRKLAVEKAQKERAERIQAEERARLKAEQERQRQVKEAELRAEKARLAQEKEAKARQLAQDKAQKEEQKKLEQEAVARKKQIKLAQQIEEPKSNSPVSVKSTTQENAINEAMFAKRQEDRAKIIKIENLWQDARKLYAKGMYEEAIRGFQKIIELEGNPRIKYTPAAKEFIEKAKEKIEEKKEANLAKEVEVKEKDMLNEVMKQQLPPYLEPPKLEEETKENPLVEPPLIRKKLKKNVTLDFDKVSLESVLAFLSQDTGVNFVTSQRVLDANFNVTARFQQTPVEEVVKYITKGLGLIYRIDKDVIWIAHPEEIAAEAPETRVYYLSKGGGLFTEFSPITGGSSDTGLGSSSAQMTKVLTIEDTLKEIVPWPADSKLYYDKRINALIIRNTPQNLQMLEDLLYNMDVTPIQILIEARFLEVDVTDTKELGITWGLTGGDYAITKKKDGSFKEGLGKDSGVDFSSFTQAAQGFNLTYKGMITNSQLQAVIHAMEESKKIKTLSSPRITTLNNQMATMKVVDEWIYPTRYEFEILQVPGQLPSQTPTYEYKNVPKDFIRRDVGILLKVIPSVGADKKTISLSLIPEVSEATADAFVYTGDVKLPKFTSRNLSTTIVANSGDTVVLGGMIKENRTKTLTKVPILGDIPFLGAAFRKNTDQVERKNLIIFVTAKILSPSGEEVIIAQK
ncbi:MAG: hypothetical protein PHV44_06580, partial [Candidatus Omnitrophica bacterium]|nr:hypothetical protein [Candidatus Omnitrophota bacterium]